METRSLPLSGGTNPQPFRLDGKVAIVTGGGSGIGQAIALRFAVQGAVVRIFDLNESAAIQTISEITKSGGIASAHVCDVSNQSAVTAAINEIARQERIHVLVNNAGISHIGTIESTSEQDFTRILTINVKGYYNCMRAAVGHMKQHGGGVILNLASIAGSAGIPDRFAYSVTKGAVVAMTYSVARDYISHNVRCNCISPARVHTPFVDDYLRKNYPGREQEMFSRLSQAQPIGRMAEPAEVASLALFLCSDEARFITGVDYPIDGGFFNLRG